MSKMSLRAFPAPIFLGALCLAALTTAAEAQVAEVSAIRTTMVLAAAALQSIALKAPATGNMIVTAAGQVNYAHALGTLTTWCVDLSQTSGDVGGCAGSGGSSAAARDDVSLTVPNTVAYKGAQETYSIVHVYPVMSGQVYTFYLNGYMTSIGGLFQASLTARFVSGTLQR